MNEATASARDSSLTSITEEFLFYLETNLKVMQMHRKVIDLPLTEYR